MRKNILIGVYAWLAVSSIVLAMFAYLFGEIPVIAFSAKDAPIYLGIAVLCFWGVPSFGLKAILPCVGIALLLLVQLITSDADLIAKAASLRQLLSVYALMFLGFVAVRTPQQYLQVSRWIIGIGLAAIVFGFVERFTHLWEGGLLFNYFSSKSILTFGSGYPVFFIEPIFMELSGGGVIRMVSTFLDPINFGHSLVLLISLLYFQKLGLDSSLRVALIFFALFALFLTFSKGSWLQLVLVFTLMNQKLSTGIRLVALASFITILLMAATVHAGVVLHLKGFMESISTATSFGYGLGAAGNYASMLGQDLVVQIGDTFVGLIIGQIGVIGLILWAYPLIKATRYIGWDDVVSKVFIAQLIVASLSENTFNLLAIAGVSLLLGAKLGVKYNWQNTKPTINSVDTNMRLYT